MIVLFFFAVTEAQAKQESSTASSGESQKVVKQKSAQAGESQFSAAQKAWSKNGKKQGYQNRQNTKAREQADAQVVRAAAQLGHRMIPALLKRLKRLKV